MPDSLLPRDGLVIVAKRDCPTCVLVEPVMQSLDRAGPLMVLSQDDPTFPSGVRSVIYDDSLERSFHLKIEAVPTVIRFQGGREIERAVGWDRAEWLKIARCRGTVVLIPSTRNSAKARCMHSIASVRVA